LRAAGHAVFTPTLTGLGDRFHLRRDDTDLNTHISDIVGAIACEELSDVILVGHSYGGAVIAGATDRMRGRIRRLVFFDTGIPQDGKSVVDLFPTDLSALGAGSGDADLPVPPVTALGVAENTPDAAWLERRLRPHPLISWEQKLRFGNGGFAGIPASFIRCTRPPLPTTAFFADAARQRGWPVYEIETGHDAMVTEPEKLATILIADARAEANLADN
jgi:pimeloyl-ACP methyl ester carboxylesterase